MERSKPEGDAERFSIYIFSIRNEVKDLEFALAKLRGLCKYLASVYNSHSHVYGLHRLIFVHENKAENQCNEASLNIKYGEVSLQIEFTTLPPKPQPLFETK